MKEIIITTQTELDALPSSFTESTRIIIKNTTSTLVVKTSWENSSVEARENSSVEARENSSVVARENCVVRVFSASIKLVLYGFAVAFLPITINLNIEKHSEHCHVQIVQDLGWFENNAVEQTPIVTLYKRVSKDYKTQEDTDNETLWLIGSTITHPVWSPNKSECGSGKFHACSRPYFCDEFRSKRDDRYVAISIKLEDLHEWKDNPEYPHKIAFKTGTVLYECDRFGKKIK